MPHLGKPKWLKCGNHFGTHCRTVNVKLFLFAATHCSKDWRENNLNAFPYTTNSSFNCESLFELEVLYLYFHILIVARKSRDCNLCIYFYRKVSKKWSSSCIFAKLLTNWYVLVVIESHTLYIHTLNAKVKDENKNYTRLRTANTNTFSLNICISFTHKIKAT